MESRRDEPQSPPFAERGRGKSGLNARRTTTDARPHLPHWHTHENPTAPRLWPANAPELRLAARPRRSELFDLDVQGLDAVGDLPRGHAEQARGAGLDPAGFLQRADDALALALLGARCYAGEIVIGLLRRL